MTKKNRALYEATVHASKKAYIPADMRDEIEITTDDDSMLVRVGLKKCLVEDMVVGLDYVVLESYKELKSGDIIRLNAHGMLRCNNAGGFLLPEEWERLKQVKVMGVER